MATLTHLGAREVLDSRGRPTLEVEAPLRRPAVIVAPLPSATSTLDARVLQAMAASRPAPAGRSRRRIGLVLGAAASLLLAIGIAASAVRQRLRRASRAA